jgi:hypothetical protein
MNELLLLDPYRSALIARAFNEDLLQISADIDIRRFPFSRIGCDRKFQDDVLQMALLFDDLLVVYHEKTADNEIAPVKSLKKRAGVGLPRARFVDSGC